ncbi:hypothetical protein AZ003_001304 [Citrobacter freundii]|nr:hypothetical protein AZ003_001304 [Citrobacter freundii]
MWTWRLVGDDNERSASLAAPISVLVTQLRKPRERARHVAENDGFQAGFNLNVNALLPGVEFNILIQLYELSYWLL